MCIQLLGHGVLATAHSLASIYRVRNCRRKHKKFSGKTNTIKTNTKRSDEQN